MYKRAKENIARKNVQVGSEKREGVPGQKKKKKNCWLKTTTSSLTSTPLTMAWHYHQIQKKGQHFDFQARWLDYLDQPSHRKQMTQKHTNFSKSSRSWEDSKGLPDTPPPKKMQGTAGFQRSKHRAPEQGWDLAHPGPSSVPEHQSSFYPQLLPTWTLVLAAL